MVAQQKDIVHHVPGTQRGREDNFSEKKHVFKQQAILLESPQLISTHIDNGENSSGYSSDSNEVVSDTSVNRSDGKEKKRGGWKRSRSKHKRWSRSWKKRRKFELKESGDVSQNESDVGWLLEGSAYIGQRVRRSILDEEGEEVGYGKGNIVGWMPAEKSEFICPASGKPAPLWHLVYDEVCENDIRCDNILFPNKRQDRLKPASVRNLEPLVVVIGEP